MPVMIIGADAVFGSAVAEAIDARQREVRAFVSDREIAIHLKTLGINAAVGDVSDGSHVAGATHGCFTAIIDPAAAVDDRERSFSQSPEATIDSWAVALGDAGVTRVIWIENTEITAIPGSIRTVCAEFAIVGTQDRDPEAVAADVVRIDDLKTIAQGLT